MEAASLDGANGFRRFLSMSVPLLSPTTFFLLITTMLSSLQAFDLIRIMTPLGSGTSTLIYEAYLQAFGAYNRAGYSAAISVVLFAILLVITVLQLRFVEQEGALLVSRSRRRSTRTRVERPTPSRPRAAVLPRQPGQDSRCRLRAR